MGGWSVAQSLPIQPYVLEISKTTKSARNWPLITSKDDSFFDDDGFEYKLKIQEKPLLDIPRRIYSYSLAMPIGYGGDIPNFNSTLERFYDDFEIHYKRIMAWSIAYSRHSIDNKIGLLTEYYSSETYPTFFSIGKKLKSVDYFNWLKQMAC